MHGEIDMKVKCVKAELLAKLKSNRDKHATIVKEARVGYVKAARAALTERLKELESGKLSSLSFNLSPPQDYTKTYNTAIQMLELHTDDTIILSAGEVRNFVMDQWDWRSRFLLANSSYSGTAQIESANENDE